MEGYLLLHGAVINRAKEDLMLNNSKDENVFAKVDAMNFFVTNRLERYIADNNLHLNANYVRRKVLRRR